MKMSAAVAQGDLALPACPEAAFEVVQTQAGLEFAVVGFDPPVDAFATPASAAVERLVSAPTPLRMMMRSR